MDKQPPIQINPLARSCFRCHRVLGAPNLSEPKGQPLGLALWLTAHSVTARL